MSTATLDHELDRAVRVAGSLPPGEDLARGLYVSWYARPVTPVEPARPQAPPLTGALGLAALGAGHWVPATVRRVDPLGAVVVRPTGGGHRVVLPGAFTRLPGCGGAGLPPEVGEQVRVAPLLGGVVVGGWWRVWSPGWDPRSRPPAGLTRVYVCAAPARHVEVVRRVLTALLPLQRGWLLKSALDPATLARPDRVVVYLPDEVAAPALATLGRETAGLLSPYRPPLTVSAAPGLAWAQDDGDVASFGENRCAALARGLRAWQARGGVLGDDDDDALAEARDHCRQGLRDAGLDPDRPHLRPRATVGQGTDR
ncbi:T3SS effector HopA1 family protein [Serinicoccus sp. LYQ131]|uniref:T3SS effector HopA1 family protein n=1 Tax=Serinicoccus sp. LYQ131 TaxID=3378797 RepID=UPI003853FF81